MLRHFPIETYALLNVLALFVFALVAGVCLRRRGHEAAPAIDLAVLMAWGYWFGARILHTLLARDFSGFQLDGPLWGGQLAFAALAVIYLFRSRVPVADVADALAPGWAAATVLHKLACFAAG